MVALQYTSSDLDGTTVERLVGKILEKVELEGNVITKNQFFFPRIYLDFKVALGVQRSGDSLFIGMRVADMANPSFV